MTENTRDEDPGGVPHVETRRRGRTREGGRMAQTEGGGSGDGPIYLKCSEEVDTMCFLELQA